MNEQIGISIAMATYNGAVYLRHQLDSLLEQTLPFDELVICDDCSSDNTVSVIREYASRDCRIRLYKNRVYILSLHQWF